MAEGSTGDGQEKSFEPTPRKLEQAREQGDVPRSIDVNAAAAYLGLLAVLVAFGGAAARAFGREAQAFLGAADRLGERLLGPGGLELGGALIGRMALTVAPLFVVPAVAVFAALMAQQALVFSAAKLEPKLSRIDPIEIASQKFGVSGLVEFLKSAVKMALIATALWWWLLAHADEVVGLAGMPARALPAELGRMSVSMLGLVAAIATAIGAVDLLWQRYDHARRLRMSLEEMQRELKETEGDPYMKSARRGRAEAIAKNRMLQAVPKADVVIVNPTHYAVALQWSRKRGAAPVCTAKGVDAMAAAIRARAIEAGVPIHADPPTARALHASVEIGREIRPEHYRAVAAAIRFAEDIRRRAREQGFGPTGRRR